ncbi:RNA polymerase sigma-70 factor [Dyadobacter sp. CY343]|uniref:RNA polymerase sigma-70 factor n=1 Tax=Dyadobacter sp. CY343 TaxID=2907299 RepID=UPI001F3DAF57|nr:RNA polymerase sigma-70 factor [Dyadobacter sp. CY343]MCE7063261.1 RNA polymerase sigma-70 factor [Dyadobacter sp. CY343]
MTDIHYPTTHLPDTGQFAEKEILTSSQEGDSHAFQNLYKQYHGQVQSYAMRFSQCSDGAQDITQDVFLKIWENRKRLAKVKCMDAYLYTMCKNRSATICTSLLREQQALQNLAYEYQDLPAEAADELAAEQRSKWLSIAIRQLPPQRRRIFRLCKMEGKTHRQAALELNVSPGTINDHIVKATRAIRKFLYLCGSFQET